MKCSSRRNCDCSLVLRLRLLNCLNEVQFPKELRPRGRAGLRAAASGLNEVQFPKELRQQTTTVVVALKRCLNEVQFPKELRQVAA